LQEPNRILLEVGPWHFVPSLFSTEQAAGQVVLLHYGIPRINNQISLLNILGRLWLAGVPVNWSGFMLNVTVCLYQLTRLSASVTGLKRRAGEPSQGSSR